MRAVAASTSARAAVRAPLACGASAPRRVPRAAPPSRVPARAVPLALSARAVGVYAAPRARTIRTRAATDGDASDRQPIADVIDPQLTAVDSKQFFLGSVTFYVVMTLGSQVVCGFADVHPDVIDSASAINLDQAVYWMIPLLASLTFAVTQSEKFEFLRVVRETFEQSVLPAVAPLGVLGIAALSLGAGVGEEALFRGFLMPWVDARLGDVGASADVAAGVSLASTSLVFGALHAITPQYAIWATWASVIFSLESIRDGLGSAMFTHAFYDFLAFLYIIVAWMPPSADE
jgi:membrane protease YdiL (CAAX protease family)